MTPSQHEPPHARRALAVLLGVLVLLVGLMSVAPQLHGQIHHDCGDAGHSCAATLFAHGVTTLSATPVVAVPAQAFGRDLPPVPPAQIRPAPALRLPPTCGPPRR